ncbi:hypothetical protein B1B04_25035 [Lysinibacillus sp. KCTC 33748]|uniref:hypothetical protein n=1 Tax=unclassified Lysinibacillus TaxID=2636778 RepID=UPI0009A79C7B|nr:MULTISPECIES: hypothetical protein [unclassified Lysinibacillus]OXS65576.1 hypothetical protein B1B04_25035 [Lysinibacillus sp. KCTC 33748]
MDERKRRMQQKIQVVKQKNQRTNLMNLFPKHISSVIEKSELITSPELERILNKVHEKWNYELHKVDFAIKYRDFRKEFSWEHEVIDYVQRIDFENKLVYLFFGIGDCPIFIVDGKWALMNFSILWEHINNYPIWIISQDFSFGILVSRYLGYLKHDPNPKEIFYAITKWDQESKGLLN